MPPVKTKTSVGLETPQQTMDRASSLLKRTGFTAKIPDSIPSTAISEGGTFTDVRARRDQMESDQMGRQQFDTDFNNLMGRVQSPLQSSPFQNPEQFINEMLLRRPSETETQLGNVQSEQAQGFRDVGRDLNRTREKLTNEFDIGGLQANLADTRNRIAERTTQLRQSLRDFETNAEKRGVARPFVDAEKQKVQADAAAELADLAIIESAQSGNLQMAREDIDRALDQKIQAFEFENMAIQTEIQRLEKMDSKESEVRSQELQMALDERNRLVEKAVADERQKLEYLSEAAANGADQGTLDAIRKATNVGEAAMMAGPFIGKLDREASQASTAASWALAQERLTGGDSITTESGETLTVPTFDEWLDQKGTAEPMQPFSQTEYANLQKEYEEDVAVMEQAVRVSSLSPMAREIVNNPKAYYDLTPSARGEIFEEMAKKGIDTNAILTGKKKSLPATQAESLAQASGVKADVEKLYTMLKALPGTGPIAGRLQALDPYNAQRKAVEAQITRIVPGLARGIFNEVGVLTDSDVTRYRDTLANPNMTDAQIEALHNDTLSKIDQSIATTIDTFSLLGYDLGTYGQDKTATDGLSEDEAYEEYKRITGQQ